MLKITSFLVEHFGRSKLWSYSMLKVVFIKWPKGNTAKRCATDGLHSYKMDIHV